MKSQGAVACVIGD